MTIEKPLITEKHAGFRTAYEERDAAPEYIYEQTSQTVALTEAAKAFHAQLFAVNLAEVPVMTEDRHCRRKETAKLLRTLLSRIGVKGVSVTAPNYSMAQAIDVRLPSRRDEEFEDGERHRKNPKAAGNKANRLANERFREILAVAFPNHDDRSDSQSDHFDYKWSIR